MNVCKISNEGVSLMNTLLKCRVLMSKTTGIFNICKRARFVCFILSTVFLCSCAIFPINSHHTARTVGQDNWEFEAGTATNFDNSIINVSNVLLVYMSATKGLSQDFDLRFSLGAQGWQAAGLQLSGKHAFLNSSGQGLSFALTGGVDTAFIYAGVLFGSLHLGPVLSYRAELAPYAFEPYITLLYRLNGVKLFAGGGNNIHEKMLLQTLNRQGIYIVHTLNPVLGCNFWFTQSLALNLNIGVNFSLGSSTNTVTTSNTVTSGGLGMIWSM